MGLVRVLVVLVVVASVLAPGSGLGSGDVAAAQTADDLCDGGSAVGFPDVGVGDYAAEYVLCMRVCRWVESMWGEQVPTRNL